MVAASGSCSNGRKIRSGLGSAASVTPAQARRSREEFVVRWRNCDVLSSNVADDANLTDSEPTFGEAVEEFISHWARVKNWRGGADGAEAKSYRAYAHEHERSQRS